MIFVRRFEPRDQQAARAVILAGMREHFGFIDETLNQDIDDIASSYADGLFVVACDGDTIAGTGAVTPRPDATAIVTRMSTAAPYRRRGVARAVLSHLVEYARQSGCTRVVLGTNIEWAGAMAFYAAFGFTEMRRTPTGVLFELAL